MNRILMISFVLMLSLMVQAQDEKSKNILDKVSQTNRSYKTISADFTFSMHNDEMGIDERNQGTIKLKGQKYVVELPGIGVQVYSDGTTIWHYMKAGNQVTVSNIEDGENDLMDPASLFSIYEKGFNSKFVAEKKEDGKVLYHIDLFPDDSVRDVTKISLFIDKATSNIHSARLYATDGNTYGIDVKKMETNKELPDAVFQFNSKKYPDIEVIDFR